MQLLLHAASKPHSNPLKLDKIRMEGTEEIIGELENRVVEII